MPSNLLLVQGTFSTEYRHGARSLGGCGFVAPAYTCIAIAFNAGLRICSMEDPS